MVFQPLPDNCDGDKSRMNMNVSQSSLQHAGEIKVVLFSEESEETG